MLYDTINGRSGFSINHSKNGVKNLKGSRQSKVMSTSLHTKATTNANVTNGFQNPEDMIDDAYGIVASGKKKGFHERKQSFGSNEYVIAAKLQMNTLGQ